LTTALALILAALASSAFAVPAPTLFLLITVVYAGALGGWKGGRWAHATSFPRPHPAEAPAGPDRC
jgi:hypothetical protein